MRIVRTSALTNRLHIRELPVTEQEIARWQSGELAQNVWPHLTAEQREFIMTGVTPSEWETAFGPNADSRQIA